MPRSIPDAHAVARNSTTMSTLAAVHACWCPNLLSTPTLLSMPAVHAYCSCLLLSTPAVKAYCPRLLCCPRLLLSTPVGVQALPSTSVVHARGPCRLPTPALLSVPSVHACWCPRLLSKLAAINACCPSLLSTPTLLSTPVTSPPCNLGGR